MKTADLIAKLPVRVVEHVRYLGTKYNESGYSTSQSMWRTRLAEYTNGLRDAGLIDDREKSQLFIYGTCIYEKG